MSREGVLLTATLLLLSCSPVQDPPDGDPGGLVSQLLDRHPEGILSAAYGDSGVREVDEERLASLPADIEGHDPLDDEAREMLQASPTRDEEALAAIRAHDPH